MKNDVLEYKGYYAKVEYDATTHTLFGKIEGIRDLVTFEGGSLMEIDAEFHAAVDDYLAFCEEVGKEILSPKNPPTPIFLPGVV